MERKVLTYKDLEEAKRFIGKSGLFGGDMEDLANGEEDGNVRGVLVSIYASAYHFGVGSKCYQFFSPDPEPVEKWVPFTAEDFTTFGRGRVWIKFKTNHATTQTMLILGVLENGIWYHNALGDTPIVHFTELLANYTFADGTPCGKKITEQ